jgi:predicted acyl esterase
MRTRTFLTAAAVATLAAVAPAHAAIPAVFTDAPTPVNCVVQTGSSSMAGQRHCTGATGPNNVSTVPSFDGTPIDVTVTLPPAPAGGADGNYPVIGVFHGYGGQKFAPSSSTVQRWAGRGYAVLSITDRGFWASCGALVPTGPGPCEDGYIRLMSNAYEIRDVQHLLGLLADEGVIHPTRIGATGGSYGGGMALQLGALKNRVQLEDDSLVPWTSPNGTPMAIAATAPEYTWSDLQASLQPNGSTLDYAAENPYSGPAGDRRFGIQKQLFSTQLYFGGLQAGYYAPINTDPTANITAWKGLNDTGGPYDGHALAIQQTNEFPNHGGYYTDISEAPAPALLVNGWNDDLFPVNESVRYYNRVRTAHPDAPIKMFHLNIGHTPRGAGTTFADIVQVIQEEVAWMDHYVRDRGTEPTDATGGVDVLTTRCVGTTPSNGERHSAENWADLSQGEIRVDGAASQIVDADSAPVETFQTSTTNACVDGPAADTPGAAVYETEPAPAGGFTIAGAPTVVADLTVAGANDAVISRLYDVDPQAGTAKLIARGVYRPTGVGTTSRQVFQLAPQAYRIAPGHVVKLELLGEDQPFVRKSTGQNDVAVGNLELRLPTADAPGAAGGLIQEPAAKVLPTGYTLAHDEQPEPVVPLPPAPPAPPAPPLPPARTPVLVTHTDPVPWQTVRTALRKRPSKVRIARNGSSVRFRESLPEAGRITYGISVRTRSGKGKRLRTSAIGQAKYVRTGPGAFDVKITVSKRGRTLLRKHRKASIILRSYFISPVEKRHVNTKRTLARR